MELPESWTVEPFSDVARYATGRTPARANPAYWAEGANQVPWVAISDMEEYGTLIETAESISEAAFKNVFRERIAPAGTLLMSFKLTIGRVATLGVPACHNEAIISIYPRQGVDQRYLGYFLSQVDYTDHQDRQIKGNTLNQSKIDQIQVALPPPDEQARIADVLDRCRLGIDTERTAEATAQELKRAAMRELFTRGLRGEAQKETEIGLVPESWEVAEFQSVREWLQYGTSIHCSVEKRRYPVLRIPNVEPGRVNAADLKYCDLTAEDAAKYVLQSGDLLFIRTNGVLERLGSCAVYQGEPAEALFASYLIRARLKSGIEPRYVAYFYASDMGTSLVAGRATPAADGKYNLNTGTIDSLPLPLPPTLDEQREIVAILDAIDRKIDLHRQKRAVLEELFQSLLQKLMAGDIRVADLDLSALEQAQASETTT
nr:restriction endonuclease subunit S [Pseudoxanthomonas sp.]